MKLIRRIDQLIMSIGIRKRVHLLYFLIILNIIFFLLVYHRLILITPSTISFIDVSISSFNGKQENVEEILNLSSSICYIPHFDPWDQTVAKTIKIKPVYRCPTNRPSLINVVDFNQLIVNQTVNETFYSNTITYCVYLKIGRNPEQKLFRDWSYTLTEPLLMVDGQTNPIDDADFVLTRCYNDRSNHFDGDSFW